MEGVRSACTAAWRRTLVANMVVVVVVCGRIELGRGFGIVVRRFPAQSAEVDVMMFGKFSPRDDCCPSGSWSRSVVRGQADGDWRERRYVAGQVEGGELGTGEQVAGFKKESQVGGRGLGGSFSQAPDAPEGRKQASTTHTQAAWQIRTANQMRGAPLGLGFLGRRPECETTPFGRRQPALARCTLLPPPDSRPVSSRCRRPARRVLTVTFSKGQGHQSIANSNRSGDTFGGFCSCRSS